MTPDEHRAEEGWKDWKKQEARILELEQKLEESLNNAISLGKKARAEERERCLYVAPFMKTRAASDEAPQVCWKNGYNAGVAAYKTRIRALGDKKC